MNSVSPNRFKRDERQESQLSEADQQKLFEGQMQLEGEAESRTRRIQLRKERQAKLEAIRSAKRRKRAFKLAGFWLAAICGGFVAVAWYSNEVMALIAS